MLRLPEPGHSVVVAEQTYQDHKNPATKIYAKVFGEVKRARLFLPIKDFFLVSISVENSTIIKDIWVKSIGDTEPWVMCTQEELDAPIVTSNGD